MKCSIASNKTQCRYTIEKCFERNQKQTIQCSSRKETLISCLANFSSAGVVDDFLNVQVFTTMSVKERQEKCCEVKLICCSLLSQFEGTCQHVGVSVSKIQLQASNSKMSEQCRD